MVTEVEVLARMLRDCFIDGLCNQDMTPDEAWLYAAGALRKTFDKRENELINAYREMESKVRELLKPNNI